MKKFLVLFSFLAVFFASCSNDVDLVGKWQCSKIEVEPAMPDMEEFYQNMANGTYIILNKDLSYEQSADGIITKGKYVLSNSEGSYQLKLNGEDNTSTIVILQNVSSEGFVQVAKDSEQETRIYFEKK